MSDKPTLVFYAQCLENKIANAGRRLTAAHYLFQQSQHPGIHIIWIWNTDHPEDVKRVLSAYPTPSCVISILLRPNRGYDFGAWTHALDLVRDQLDDYHSFLFVNDSVVGPFIPFSTSWSIPNWTWLFRNILNIPNFELVSCTSSNQYFTHCQTYCFALSHAGPSQLFDDLI